MEHCQNVKTSTLTRINQDCGKEKGMLRITRIDVCSGEHERWATEASDKW